MGRRAESSGVVLSEHDAAVVKGMLARGDRQHDIAAWFGVNGGRIAEVSMGKTFSHVAIEASANLPPPGPYPNGRDITSAVRALIEARSAIDEAISRVASH